MSLRPMRPLRRAAVLGSGVMGAQIAAYLAGLGVAVDLLDLADPEASGEGRSRLAREALDRLPSLRPSPLPTSDARSRIRPGNLEDHLDRVSGVDWVIEAVVEDPQVKGPLLGAVARHTGPKTLLSTNTSGLSVAALSEALDPQDRPRFLGTHFFNPPRYLRLVELVPGPATDPAWQEQARLWLERDLGKGVVVVRDSPGFVANRLGAYAVHVTLWTMLEQGLTPEAVDALTGPAIGHPASATFGTLDLVGLDVAAKVADHLAQAVADPQERQVLALPPFFRRMVAEGLLGRKVGQGFYRRAPGEGRARQVIDLDTFTYRDPRPVRFPSLEAANRLKDPAERLRRLVAGDDPGARLIWTVLKRTLLHAARLAQDLTGGDLEAIDRAMRWGYGWQLGPFETWAALGLAESVGRMEAEGEAVPDFVREAVQAGQAHLYPPSPPPLPTALPPPRERVVWQSDSATLVDLGEDVAGLLLHPPKQAIGPDLMEALHRAAREVEDRWRGLVLGSPWDDRFLVGANLMLLLAAAQAGDFAAIEQSVRTLQEVHQEVKYLGRPVVAAPAGQTLGGGSELCLHADRVVAHLELYMGQVEAAAGLIPAAGGVKELLSRTLGALPSDLPWSPALAATATGASVGGAAYLDPAPWVARLFQTLALAQVSQSALDARSLGLLRERDEVVVRPEERWVRAREVVLAMDRLGYRPPLQTPIPAPGREVRALLEVAAQSLAWSGRATAHDLTIARHLAHVLCGGDVAMGTPVTEERLLDLEREAFLSLCGEPLSQARMEHLLTTGRPLHN